MGLVLAVDQVSMEGRSRGLIEDIDQHLTLDALSTQDPKCFPVMD